MSKENPESKRSVVITGTDSGLGLAFVDTFLAEGWSVFAGYIVSDSPVNQMKSPDLTPVLLDVTDMPSIEAARVQVASHTDRLDMVINDAGIDSGKSDSLEELGFDTIHEVLDVNAVGPLRVTREFLDLLKGGTLKRIINVSSEAGSITECKRTSWFGYNMSKAALNMQTKILHNYLCPMGFSVHSVHPGGMRSNMGSPEMGFAPEDSARLLFDLITVEDAAALPRFFQFDGNELPW